jgi:hypothetical protein
VVTFKFAESHGSYQSTLGIYEVNGSLPSLVQTLFSEIKGSDNFEANEWKGSLGNTVLGSGQVAFTFLANKIYTLGLISIGGAGSQVYSTSALNGGSQQAVLGGVALLDALNKETTDTFQAAGEYTNGLAALFNGGALITFDDQGNAIDKDFQDFTVTAEAVPEPMTMTGLALGLGGLVAARRRGKKTT